MLPYELTSSTEEDLKDIARYTLTQWGKNNLCIIAVLHERMDMLTRRLKTAWTNSAKLFPITI